MDLKDAIYNRRAVREYTTQPVDENTILTLIDAAIQAPSAMNQQPWSFCIVRDRSVLDTISREAKAHMLNTSPVGLVSHHFEQILNDQSFDIFYQAPVLIVISSTAAMAWAVEDCTLAAENLMLAARAAGLGSCWIGFAQSWLGTPQGKAVLQLPETYVPIAPIIIGRPKTFPAAVPRKRPEISWIGS